MPLVDAPMAKMGSLPLSIPETDSDDMLKQQDNRCTLEKIHEAPSYTDWAASASSTMSRVSFPWSRELVLSIRVKYSLILHPLAEGNSLGTLDTILVEINERKRQIDRQSD